LAVVAADRRVRGGGGRRLVGVLVRHAVGVIGVGIGAGGEEEHGGEKEGEAARHGRKRRVNGRAKDGGTP